MEFKYSKREYHPLMLMLVFLIIWVITKQAYTLQTSLVFAIWFTLSFITDLFIYIKRLKNKGENLNE